MSRPPGKKLRTEHFVVDGTGIVVELRISDSGLFWGTIDGSPFEAPTLHAWREKVQAHLNVTRRLTWDPFIYVDFLDAKANSRYENRKGEINTEEFHLRFSAVWLSRETVSTTSRYNDTKDKRREAEGVVNPKTFEIEPLTDEHRREAGAVWHSHDLIPFTPTRWRQLCDIGARIAAVRGRIAEIVGDASGAALDALPAGRLLVEPVQDAPKKPKTR